MSLEDDARALLEPHDPGADACYLSVAEYCTNFRCSRRGVQLAIQRGQFPFPIIRPAAKVLRIRVPRSLIVAGALRTKKPIKKKSAA